MSLPLQVPQKVCYNIILTVERTDSRRRKNMKATPDLSLKSLAMSYTLASL